jgi:hypothetical protein
VEDWAEIRRLHRAEGLPIKLIARTARTASGYPPPVGLWDLSINTVHHRYMTAIDQKLTNCVAHYRNLLDARPQPPESLSQAPDSQLHRIVELAGAQRRSDQLLNRLDQAFKDAGIITYPNLVDPGLDGRSRVRRSSTDRPSASAAACRRAGLAPVALRSFIRRALLNHRGVRSGRRPAGDPALEDGDVLRRPRPVAGHRAVAEALEDRVLVHLDVAVGPEVEGFEHRVAVLFAEHRTDITLEAQPCG